MCFCNAASLNAQTTPYGAFSYGKEYAQCNLALRIAMLFSLFVLAVGVLALKTTELPQAPGVTLTVFGGVIFLGTGIGMYCLYRGERIARERVPGLVSQTWFWNVCASGHAITAQSTNADLIKIGMEYGSARVLANIVLLSVALFGIAFGSTFIHHTSHFSGPLMLGIGLAAFLGAAFAHYKLDEIKRNLNNTFAFPRQTLLSDAIAGIWQRI